MTTQFTPLELVYGTQPIMPIEFTFPTERIKDVPTKDLNQAIHVRMEHWCVGENINHIQLLQRKIGMKKGNPKTFVRVI